MTNEEKITAITNALQTDQNLILALRTAMISKLPFLAPEQIQNLMTVLSIQDPSPQALKT